MGKSPKRKRGRLHSPTAVRRRRMIGLRPSPRITALLEKAAGQSGVSLGQEAEARIARSFDRQDLLPEVLAAAYGRRAAGLLMMMSRAFGDAGTIAGRMVDPLGTELKHWTENRWATSVAMEALAKVVEPYVEPDDGEPAVEPPAAAIEMQRRHGRSIAETIADAIRQAVVGFAADDDRYTDFALSVRPLLGIDDVIVRIAAENYAKKMGSKKGRKS